MTVVIEGLWLFLGGALVVGYVVLVIYVIADLVRGDMPAWGKLAWLVAFLVVPVLSVIVYAIVRGDDPRPFPGRDRPARRTGSLPTSLRTYKPL